MKLIIKVFYLVVCLVLFGSILVLAKDITLNAAVRFEGNWLLIKNNDSFSYDYVKVQLNGGKFKAELPFSIPAGERGRHELSSFTRPDGERFNINKYSLIDVAIFCEASRQVGKRWEKLGKGFWYGKFQ